MNDLIPVERIENRIYLIRKQKVMIDKDLADLYRVENKILKRAVKRNIRRFPSDFMFELTKEEYAFLRCQIGTLKKGSHAKYLPYAFTEHGVAMLSSILRSERAIEMNIAIMRAFARLRSILAAHKDLADKFKELENKVGKNTADIQLIFEAIHKMLAVEEKPVKRIGFMVGDRK